MNLLMFNATQGKANAQVSQEYRTSRVHGKGCKHCKYSADLKALTPALLVDQDGPRVECENGAKFS